MGKINCIVCDTPLKYSKENVCGGHGDFYNKYIVKCSKCCIKVTCDNYFSSRSDRLDDKYFELLNVEYLIRAETIKRHYEILALLNK